MATYDQKLKNGDKIINSAGAITLIGGNNKLAQDIAKIVQTTLGANKFHMRYGSLLTKRLIGKALPPDIASSRADESVREAIEYLTELQEEQQLVQDVASSELVQDIKEVSVEQNNQEPRQMDAIIDIITGELNTIGIEFPVEF